MIALAGNKADLASSRMVEYEEAKQYADENGLLFMETSAKTALNVNEIFLAIGEWHGEGSESKLMKVNNRGNLPCS